VAGLSATRRLAIGLIGLAVTIGAGTVGYTVLGFGALDALYQTVTTITTVGFREVHPLSSAGKTFTIALIVVGVGTAAYTFGVAIETVVEGQLADVLGRRRVTRTIENMSGHVIICGWGRVGRAIAHFVSGAGEGVVVVDNDPERVRTVPHPAVLGDATDDAVLGEAGIARARALVAALDTDAGNLYVTLSGRALRPELFIAARARVDAAEAKLMQAGADRVVNPQAIGGARMAALALQPHVADFLDVVMHDGSLEFRLEEVEVPPDSPVASQTLRSAHLRDRTGALVLALRDEHKQFVTNPSPESELRPGQILIAIGTAAQLAALAEAVTPRS
jgi:voltage-gated potassium channel